MAALGTLTLFEAKASAGTRGGVFDPKRCRFSSSPFLLMIPFCSHVSFASQISHVPNGECMRSLARQLSPLDLSPAESGRENCEKSVDSTTLGFRVQLGKFEAILATHESLSVSKAATKPFHW